jgi:23S rRNA pseudouridine1911/1915/1917 synthase
MTITKALSARMQHPPPALVPPGLHRVEIAAAEAGERLDRALAVRLSGLSRSRLKQLIEEGRVTAAGATIREPATRVKPGEVYEVAVPEPVADTPAPQALALDVRYEDEHLLVLEKPAGLVVHPAPGNAEGTLVNALLAHCGDRLLGIGGVKRPGIVHRLDKETSGLMVVAKSDLAHAALAAGFAERTIRRAYKAVVWGVPLPRRGEMTGNIGRSPRNRQKMAVLARGGKPAVTRYEVLREFKGIAALVECRLATGRTHQIRVHFSEAGHALVGDPVYGGRRGPARLGALPHEAAAAVGGFPRQALHAYLLGFEHPATREVLEFKSDLPSDFTLLVDTLERL